MSGGCIPLRALRWPGLGGLGLIPCSLTPPSRRIMKGSLNGAARGGGVWQGDAKKTEGAGRKWAGAGQGRDRGGTGNVKENGRRKTTWLPGRY